jgi:hypothetical protein
MSKIRFQFLALPLLAGLALACKTECPNPCAKCPDCKCPDPCGSDGTEKTGATSGAGGASTGGAAAVVPATGGSGPGACNVPDCLAGKHACTAAACITPPGSSTTICEFGPTLTGLCRCHKGDKRPCFPDVTKVRTCVEVSASETKWSSCALP